MKPDEGPLMVDEKGHNEALDSFFRGVPANQQAGIVESIIGKVDSALARAIPNAIESLLQQLGITEEVAGLAHLLAARSNDTKEEVLKKALTLYGLALDAREKGNRLAILSPDDVIIHEVVGFESVALSCSPVAG